jgi:hypothetical protein
MRRKEFLDNCFGQADIPSGAQEAAEKGMFSGKMTEEHPAGAKAHVHSIAFAARLKSGPFKAASFSAACGARVHFAEFTTRDPEGTSVVP